MSMTIRIFKYIKLKEPTQGVAQYAYDSPSLHLLKKDVCVAQDFATLIACTDQQDLTQTLCED